MQQCFVGVSPGSTLGIRARLPSHGDCCCLMPASGPDMTGITLTLRFDLQLEVLRITILGDTANSRQTRAGLWGRPSLRVCS